MKVLIVSDSHGHNELLDDLIRENKDVDIFLHAGDSEVPSHTIYPFRTVKGNCDYYFDMQKELIIPSPFGNILLRHKEDASEKYLKEHDVKIFIYGHSHVKCCKKKNDICYINPGSLTYPRDEQTSYAILENDEKECFCTFYDLETKQILNKYRIYLRDPNNKDSLSAPIEEVKSEKDPLENISKEDIIETVRQELMNNK